MWPKLQVFTSCFSEVDDLLNENQGMAGASTSQRLQVIATVTGNRAKTRNSLKLGQVVMRHNGI